ncbi:nicotinate-nucleotide--dimethylbenzimidazole phosphoribosyltransferase [Anaerolineales bacterium HSG24]|nr:nicotinate-nucleotide--dimethylbenzimidazole phosphoribosyltransferase [Anaerolineales bacterium HSG24]
MVTIQPLSLDLKSKLQQKIDAKTKPLGSLGMLERVALKIGLIQNSLTPKLEQPTIIIFAGDHGIAREGVSPYPQAITYQMVLNFLTGGAAINVFCRQNGLAIKVVDAGVNHEFEPHPDLIEAKIGQETGNYLHEPAMTAAQCQTALNKGAEIIADLHQSGCNIVGFGDMGISNTSSAAILMSLLIGIPLERCVGRGTGLDEGGLQKKTYILKQAVQNRAIDPLPMTVLETFGGFEIAMMCGAMLKAAELDIILLVDGFISTTAMLVTSKLNKEVLDYAIFAHQSNERGHQQLLNYLEAEPLLKLNMRLGQGSGAALAYPLVQSAISFLNEMASFESIEVSNRK